MISNFLDETCVPLFFIISGYLFFVGVEQNFSFTAYKQKIKTRLGSVVVPLVVSNVVFLVPKLISADGQMDMMSVLSAFWSYNGSGSPINVPTWYLRDLIVVAVCSPILFVLIKRVKIVWLAMLLGCWLTDRWHLPGLGIKSISFFTIGACLSINGNGIDIIERLKIRTYWYMYVPVFIATCLLQSYIGTALLSKISVLAAFPVWVACAYGLKAAFRGLSCPKSLVVGTFFVFLYHYSIAHRVLWALSGIAGRTDMALSVGLVFSGVLTVGVLLLIYGLLRKYMPWPLGVLMGGR